MKRMSWLSIGLVSVLGILLAACAPAARVENNVLPTLVSVTVPSEPGGNVVLQGRYFGDGMGGQAAGSYVIIGANVAGEGGYRVDPVIWSENRIEFPVPELAGGGFVYVVVRGVRSNGVPANLP